jgi:hypothetical protein
MQDETLRLHLIQEYELSSDDTLFSQLTIAAMRRCSIATVERDRWVGTGVPFIKIGRSVRYRKRDIRAWLNAQPVVQSTTQFQLSQTKKVADEVPHVPE